MNFNSPKDRIIVALDVSDTEQLKRLVGELAPHVGCFKIGLELISSIGGPQAVEIVHALGGSVFYDGKFKDIPNTVGAAAQAVARQGVKMFNVHAPSGIGSLKAAVANRGGALVLGVTVLTSLTDGECIEIYGKGVEAVVTEFERTCFNWGLNGIICSPQELKIIPRRPLFIKVTPGVRPIWAAVGDQKRVMTPGEAVQAGADFLVIGRPITNAPNNMTPAEAAKRIANEIALVE